MSGPSGTGGTNNQGTSKVGAGLTGTSVGVGSASGNDSSTTRSGISNAVITITDGAAQQARTGKDADTTIASLNRNVVSGQDSTIGTPLKKTWNGQQLLQDVTAQTQITAAFGQAAAETIGDVADKKRDEAKARGDTEAEKNWDEGGNYRVALHAAAGALAGGVQGAAGAATSAKAMPTLGKLIDDIDAPQAVKQALAQVGAAMLGGAVGGTAGLASAVNVEANNRQLHPGDYLVAKKLAALSGGKYSEQEILNALRYSGIKDSNGNILVAEGTQEKFAPPGSLKGDVPEGTLFNVRTGTSIQEARNVDGAIPLRPDPNYPKILVEDKPTLPSNDLMDYIQANTGGKASPYVLTRAPVTWTSASTSTVGKLPEAPAGIRRISVTVDGVSYSPLVATCPAASCTNGDSIAGALGDAATKAYEDAVNRKVERQVNVATAVIGVGGAVVSAVRAIGGIAEMGVAENVAARASYTTRDAANSGAPIIGNVRAISAEEANAPFIAKGFSPPYDAGSQVRTFTTTSEMQFVRVSTVDNPQGAFLVRAKEIAGMTPEQIQQYLALPKVPTQIADVIVPTGTNMQVGHVAAQPNFGVASKGGMQYQLLNPIPSNNFGIPRPIK